jgi:hypothetical protein
MNFLCSAEKRLQIEKKSREFVLEESITNLCTTFSKSAEFDEFSVLKTVANWKKIQGVRSRGIEYYFLEVCRIR